MTASHLEAKLEIIDLRFSAADLPRMTVLSMTDAFLSIFIDEGHNEEPVWIGNTEVVENSQEPVWTTSIAMSYAFESKQRVVAKAYHFKSGASFSDLDAHSYMGEASFLLSSLVTASSKKLTLPITEGREKGSISVTAEARTNTRDEFLVSFSAQKLANKDGFFGKSDPFLQISRVSDSGEETLVWKSTVVDNDLSPSWRPVHIPMATLCNGDIYRPLHIEIFDYDSDGRHDHMGLVKTSVHSMLENPGAPMQVLDKKKNKNAGILFANDTAILQRPTFYQFLSGGCEISLMVAIDFTDSNGQPSDPDSLHYTGNNPDELNQYQQAIQSFGEVLEPFDADHRYPVYGFGAKLQSPDGSLSATQHCFPVYGGSNHVRGIAGISRAYTDCLSNVHVAGPALLAPIIRAARDYATSLECSQESQKYAVLLLLTAGGVCDLEEAITEIIRASYTPLSIIIAGIGESSDFAGIKELDKDVGLLKRNGELACRDIVQFVKFSSARVKGKKALTSEILCEIPSQLLKYMEHINVHPNPST